MKYIANVLGVCAVALFVLSYQAKNKKGIIVINVVSRCLFVLQYILLFAFEGAVLDVTGILVSVLAGQKKKKFIKKNYILIWVLTDLVIVAIGLTLYKNFLSLFPIMGILLHTGALWLDNENGIRIVSMLGSPFWFVYNFSSGAYGSAFGDILTVCSIGLAIIRYNKLNKAVKKVINKSTQSIELSKDKNIKT